VNPSQRVRRIFAIVLLVLGGLGLAVASTGWWLERYVLDTDRFTGTANKVLDQEDTKDAITHVLVRQLSSAAGQNLELAEPLLATVVQGVVDSDAFRAIFDRALSAAHEVLVDRDVEQIVLDLTDTYDRIRSPLEQFAPGLAADLPSRDELRVVLLERSQLTTAWDLVDLIEDVVAIVTVAALVLVGAGIALSFERWRALELAAWVLVGALAVVLLSLVVMRSVVPDRIPDAVYARAAKSAFGVVTRGLVVQSITFAVFAGVVALAALWTQRHGLHAWADLFRRAWRRIEVLVPRPAEAPEVEAPAPEVPARDVPVPAPDVPVAATTGVARSVPAEVTRTLDRLLARGGRRAQHAWRAVVLLGLGLFAVLAPGGLTTVVVVLLGVGALYLALVEGFAAWRSPKPPAPEATAP
jgi:hypothetical protein